MKETGSDVRYRPIAPPDYPIVAGLITQLYEEDPADVPVTKEKIERTFAELAAHPDKGTILVFVKKAEIVGYSILVNFWSNEFGGNVLTIDELFVAREFRGRGIASDFIRYLIASRFNDAVVLELGVTPRNARARKLYEKLGFSTCKNESLHIKLG